MHSTQNQPVVPLTPAPDHLAAARTQMSAPGGSRDLLALRMLTEHLHTLSYLPVDNDVTADLVRRMLALIEVRHQLDTADANDLLGIASYGSGDGYDREEPVIPGFVNPPGVEGWSLTGRCPR
jgi:hypothetical protein